MFKNWMCALAFWILKRYEVNYFIYPVEEKQRVIEALVRQVQGKFNDQSGEFKRSQVLRAAMNTFPEAEEKELCLAIELSVQSVKK